MTRRARRLALLLLAGAAASVALPGAAAPPSLEERVAAQRAIEEVFWRHRVWPRENGTVKPSLAEVLPDSVIRERALDGLARSEALDHFWGKPLRVDQLRAELARMAAGSRDPATLGELFAVLDSDPERIAECLVRPILADRLIRSWYAYDARLHADTRRDAEIALSGVGHPAALRSLGGDYAETTWVEGSRGIGRAEGAARRRGEFVVDSKEEWDRLVGRVAGWFGLRPVRAGRRGGPHSLRTSSPAALFESLPLDRLSPLQESEDRFFVAGILRKQPGDLTIVTVSWRKRSFDEWWKAARLELAAPASEAAVAAADTSEYGALPAITATACSDGTWTAITAGQTAEERDSHSAVWTGSEMIVWGGAAAAGGLSSGGRYNPATDTWSATPAGDGAPSPRWNHSAVWTGTEMIVWGGYSGQDDTNTGGRFNPTTGTWTPTSVGLDVPAIRESHTAVWTGTEMIVWGGDSVLVGFLDTGGRYAPAADTWRRTSTGANVPAVRSLHTAVWTGTEMIVWGGLNDFGFTNSGGRYNPVGDSWLPTSLAAAVPTARDYHTAVWTGTEMIVWGGSGDTGHVNTGARYRPSPETWTATSVGTNVPTSRYLHSAVWTGTEMIVWGGYSGTRYVATGGRYNPTANSWVPTSTGTGAPAGRGYHTAVWTGSEMIVWGGYYFDGSDHVLDSGGRYDPQEDRWAPTAGWADPRDLHTAIWTGAEVIVWGGERVHPPEPVRVLGTGGRYIPATDHWASTSMGAGVPAPRQNHTAVWTGTLMIVWGGYAPPGTEHNTGARYDPTGDAWAATSVGTGTPAARDTHSAVWTGSEMIIWGGWGGLSSVDTGGRYAPSSNTWATVAAGPQSRHAHTAVWTGTEMIVWGGESFAGSGSSTRLNSGGRYAPLTNSWSATPVDGNTPAPRSGHVAVWAGDRMIVWGGRDGAAFFNSGGRYQPGAVSFTPTSSGADAPAARAYASAIWTGSEMIVWGGSYVDGAGKHFLASGGRYAPSGDRWVATSTGGAPSPRDSHSAAWTGSEMLIWGGRDAAASLADGAKYCAASCSTPPPTGSPRMTVFDDGVTTTISWMALAGATSYDLVRGGLASLRGSAGNFSVSTAACLSDDTPGLSGTDAVAPTAGDGSWYLARGVSCGGSGSYDFGATRQVGSRDAEIQASPSACP